MRLMPLTALVSFMITGGLLAGCAAPITGGLVAGIVPSGENYSNESTSTKLSRMADAANTTLTTDQQLKMPQEVLGYDQQLIDMVGKEQGIYAKQGTTPTPAWSAQIQAVLAARSQFIQNYYNKNIAPHEFVIHPMKDPQREQQDPAWQATDNSPTQAEQYEQMSH